MQNWGAQKTDWPADTDESFAEYRLIATVFFRLHLTSDQLLALALHNRLKSY